MALFITAELISSIFLREFYKRVGCLKLLPSIGGGGTWLNIGNDFGRGNTVWNTVKHNVCGQRPPILVQAFTALAVKNENYDRCLSLLRASSSSSRSAIGRPLSLPSFARTLMIAIVE